MASLTWPEWAHVTLSTYGVKVTTPPASFFKFPPSALPATVPPPPRDPSLAHPFAIPTNVYNAVLSVNVPITFALVYASVVTYLNAVNKRRNHKPWAISQTILFKLLVLLHNIFLSAFSAWTCIGMFHAIKASLEPVHATKYGLAGTIDSLCKINGPRGMASAATYDSVKSQWGILNREYRLTDDTFLPIASDVGRIWNEGLAFYGWVFYISKFYEVVDTLIIIAKGKKSSFLQTYHHAGAMLCMWAGIRYMSPPIWLFVFLNSFIHTVMYFFYFCTALGIKVPKSYKQLLTTMQIAQFVTGITYAFLHLVVAYKMPVSTPYVYHIGEKVVQGASGLAADAASEFSSAMAAVTATAGSQYWLKKLALRAAGREGLAENVVNENGQPFGFDAVHAVTDFVKREEVRYRDEVRWTHCLDTSGQAFAIYFNLLYLLPLTLLFLQFFVNSYFGRTEAQKPQGLSEKAHTVGQSFGDARRGVGRRLSEAFENSQGWNDDLDGEGVIIDRDQIREELRALAEKGEKDIEIVRKKTREAADTISEKVDATKPEEGLQELRDAVKKGLGDVQETAVHTPGIGEIGETLQKSKDSAIQQASETASGIQRRAESFFSEDTKSSVAESVSYVTERSNEFASETVQKLGEFKESIQESFQSVTQSFQSNIENGSASSGRVTQKISENLPQDAEEVKGTLTNLQQSASTKAKEAIDVATQKKDEIVQQLPANTDEVKEAAEDLKTSVSQQGQGAKEKVEVQSRDAAKKIEDLADDAEQATVKGSGAAQGIKHDVSKETEKSEAEEDAKTSTLATTVVESSSVPKAEQDQVIAESQAVRDDNAGPKENAMEESMDDSKHEDLSESYVKDDLSYAEAVKETPPEVAPQNESGTTEDKADMETSKEVPQPENRSENSASADSTRSGALETGSTEGKTAEADTNEADDRDQDKEDIDHAVISARTSLLSRIISSVSIESRTKSDPAVLSTTIHSSPSSSRSISRTSSVTSSPEQSFYSVRKRDQRQHDSSSFSPTAPSITTSHADFWTGPSDSMSMSTSSTSSFTSQRSSTHRSNVDLKIPIRRRSTPPSPTPILSSNRVTSGGQPEGHVSADKAISSEDDSEHPNTATSPVAPSITRTISEPSSQRSHLDASTTPTPSTPTSATDPNENNMYFSFEGIKRRQVNFDDTDTVYSDSEYSETGEENEDNTTRTSPGASSTSPQKWHARRRGKRDSNEEAREGESPSSVDR